jgi:hypothetical protein
VCTIHSAQPRKIPAKLLSQRTTTATTTALESKKTTKGMAKERESEIQRVTGSDNEWQAGSERVYSQSETETAIERVRGRPADTVE